MEVILASDFTKKNEELGQTANTYDCTNARSIYKFQLSVLQALLHQKHCSLSDWKIRLEIKGSDALLKAQSQLVLH